MKRRILVGLVACVVGLSACGQGPEVSGRAEGADRPRDAVEALRRAGTARVSGVGVHTFLDSGVEKKVRTALVGSYEAGGGPSGDIVHLKGSDPDQTGDDAVVFDTWDLGDLMVWPNFTRRDSDDEDQPPPRPWAATYRTAQYRHASPLSAFMLIDQAIEAQPEGHETVDGVDTTRWTAVTPAGAAYRMFGYGDYPGVAVDCQAGFPLTVWIDPEGRLRRLRFLTEMYDGSSFDGVFTFANLGKPVGADAALPPEDQIAGSLDPQDHERQPRRGSDPCAPTDEQPTGVDRSACTPSSLEGFESIDRLGRFTPGPRGRLHFTFKEPTPAPAAFDVSTGLPVVDFDTEYIGPGGWELTRSAWPGLPPDFDPTDQAAVRAILSNPEAGEQAPPDVKLLGISLEGTWAELAAEASNCRYESAVR